MYKIIILSLILEDDFKMEDSIAISATEDSVIREESFENISPQSIMIQIFYQAIENKSTHSTPDRPKNQMLIDFQSSGKKAINIMETYAPGASAEKKILKSPEGKDTQKIIMNQESSVDRKRILKNLHSVLIAEIMTKLCHEMIQKGN
jgi:hypothetical protein